MRLLPVACLCVSLLPRAEAQLLQAGRLAVGCDGDGKVHVFGSGGNPQGQAPLAPAVAQQPSDVAFGPDGRVYVVSSGTHEVLVLDSEGGQLDAFPLAGDSAADALAFGPDGLLWVLDDGHDELLRFDTAGIPKASLPVPPGSYPEAGLAFGADGRVLLASPATDSVLELDPATGAVIRELGAGELDAPRGLAVAPDGRLHVCEAIAVAVLDADGDVVETLGDASFEDLRGLAFGPDGKLYVADAGADKVHVLTDGQVTDHVGGATLEDPVCVAFAPHRFKATLKGTLARAGQALSKVKETSVVITLLPGSRTMMVALTDDVTEDSDLSSVFGATFLVFRGFEAAEDDGAKVRLWQGTQVAGPAAAAGLASLSLQVNGSMKQGQFVPKNGKGTLLRNGAAGVYSATVKLGKAVK